MKISLLIVLALAIDFLQAELLDLNPLIQIMSDAPVLAVFVWLFAIQQKQQDKLIKAIVQMSARKPKDDDDE